MALGFFFGSKNPSAVREPGAEISTEGTANLGIPGDRRCERFFAARPLRTPSTALEISKVQFNPLAVVPGFRFF